MSTLYTFSIIYEMLNNECNRYNNIFNLLILLYIIYALSIYPKNKKFWDKLHMYTFYVSIKIEKYI